MRTVLHTGNEMNSEEIELIGAFEEHPIDDIRRLIKNGIDLTKPLGDRLPIDWLTTMYTREPRFSK